MNVKHRSKPAEPYAAVNAYGVITPTDDEGGLRVTPAHRGIPAMAYVSWEDGKYETWERLSDLIVLKPRKS